MKLRNYIKHLRTKRGWTIEDLARKIHTKTGGMKPTRNCLRNLENGNGGPTVNTIEMVALAFDMTPGALLTAAETAPPDIG